MVHKKEKPAAEQERGREMEKILKTQNERHRKRKQLSENGKERESLGFASLVGFYDN